MPGTVAEHLAASLAAHDVRRVFGVPSESFTTFMDALYAEPALEFVAARHEGGAAFLAEAYALARGNVGVVLGGRAVGAANLSIGVYTARENATPLLVLVGQMSARHRGREGFQEADLAAFLAPVAKHAMEEPDPRRVPAAVATALRLARTGRPGPVVLSLPEDVFAAAASDEVAHPAPVPRPAPSDVEVSALLAMLAAAERPLVVAGAGVRRDDAQQRLAEFAERYGLPVATAWRRHDAFDNRHPHYVGQFQLGAHPEIWHTMERADLILAFGARLNENTTRNYSAVAADARIVQVDVEPALLGKAYPADLAIVSNVDCLLAALLAVDEQRQPVLEWTTERRDAYTEVSALGAGPHADRVDNRQIIRMLRAELPDNAIITNDAGNFSGWLHTFFSFRRPGTYVGAASGAMGYGLPAAIGARLAHPDRPVVALAGDGGFLMTAAELETAVRLNVRVVVLVFNNNMYGSIRMHQERAFPGRQIGSALGNPDFVALAESFGALGIRVLADAEFPAALRRALAAEVPAVIELRTDPEQISVWQTIGSVRES